MPKEFEEDSYRLFFYSNEHRPIHVHVQYGAGEAVFIMEPAIELSESHGLKVREPAVGGAASASVVRRGGGGTTEPFKRRAVRK